MTRCWYADCERLAEVRGGEYPFHCACGKPFCDHHSAEGTTCRICDPWQPRIVVARCGYSERVERVEILLTEEAHGYGPRDQQPVVRAGDLVIHHCCDDYPWWVAAVATWRATTRSRSGIYANADKDRESTPRVTESLVLLPAAGTGSRGEYDPWGTRWTAAAGCWTAPQVLGLLGAEPQRAAALLPRLCEYRSDLTDRAVTRQLGRLLDRLVRDGACAGSARRGWRTVT